MGAGLSVDRWTKRLKHVRRFGFQVGVYDVYTEVSQYMDWIEKTILSNGGMSACGFTFSAPPSTDGTACNIGGCGRFCLKNRAKQSVQISEFRFRF